MIGFAVAKVFRTFHLQRKPRAQDVWFHVFRKLSVYGKEVIHERIEPMIPIENTRVVFLPGSFISVFVFPRPKIFKTIKPYSKVRRNFPFCDFDTRVLCEKVRDARNYSNNINNVTLSNMALGIFSLGIIS